MAINILIIRLHSYEIGNKRILIIKITTNIIINDIQVAIAAPLAPYNGIRYTFNKILLIAPIARDTATHIDFSLWNTPGNCNKYNQ